MPKIKYKNNTGNKSVKGGTLVPFHKEGNTTYFKVFANDPLKTDSVLVGPNNKNGIALDNNEIVKETKNHIEVASDDLGTVNVIENLSNRMPLPDAFRQGFIRQELYKNNNKNNNRFVEGGQSNKEDNKDKQGVIDFFIESMKLNNIRNNAKKENEIYLPIKMSNGRIASMNDMNSKKELFYDIIKSRYNTNRTQLEKRGFNEEQTNRLAKLMTKQNIAENGWFLNSNINNYGGMKSKGKNIKFDSIDSYYDSWFDMMNERWPDWVNAKDYKEFSNIINHDDLGLKEEKEIEAYKNKYRKENNGKEIYWYAPYYNNDNKIYRDQLGAVSERSDYYMNILDKERKIEESKNNGTGIFYKPSFFTGGRIRMVDGGDKKGSGLDLSKFTKRIDKNGKPYLIYDNNIFGRIYNVEHLKTTNLPKINQVDFDSIPVSNTSDGFGFIANTNNTNNDYTTDIKRNYYSTSKYSDRPNKTNNDNMSNKQQKIYIDRSVSRYSDKPIKSNDSSIKENEFVGPVLNGNGFIEPAIVTAEQVTKPVSSSIKQKNKLRKIDNNLLTSDYNPTDIAPNKEIEDITLDNTFAKQVADQTLGGYEYLSPIDVLNPIKRQVQSPVKKGVYSIGKSGPSFIDKVRLGWDKFKSSMTPARAALLGSTAADVAGNIINAGIERNAIDSTRYVDAPIQHQASKLLTNYNINPQLDSIANSAANAQRNIEENTLSSKVAQNRLNMLGLNTSLNNNQLYAQKENTETQLINQDTMNQQSIRNSNIDSYNQWLAGKTEFDNNKILSKANATASAINGIGQTLGNLATGLLQEQQFNNNVELLKAMNPDAAKVVPAKCGGRYNKKRRK